MMIEVAGKNTRQVAKSLRGMPQIHALHSTNGAFDLIAEIEVANSWSSTACSRPSDRSTESQEAKPACCWRRPKPFPRRAADRRSWERLIQIQATQRLPRVGFRCFHMA